MRNACFPLPASGTVCASVKTMNRTRIGGWTGGLCIAAFWTACSLNPQPLPPPEAFSGGTNDDRGIENPSATVDAAAPAPLKDGGAGASDAAQDSSSLDASTDASSDAEGASDSGRD
jgi:hypothetical protein